MEPLQPIPLPARFLEPWLKDNADFIENEIVRRSDLLAGIRDMRGDLQDQIRRAEPCNPSSLGAVDAALAQVPLGDLVHILVQAVRVGDDGDLSLGPIVRVTGVAGHEMSQSATPLRVAEECAILATSRDTTIADTSFWSILMEVNQAITLNQHHSTPHLSQAVKRLTEGGLFLETIRNMNVIAMSKKGEAHTLSRHLSDREAYGRILEAGEYIEPRPIAEALQGNFGIEKRGFTNAEGQEIRNHYDKSIGVTYFKPHAWSRAYRIEAHLEILRSPSRLMPILAAVSKHTMVKSIIEPWPQFLADCTAKQISHVALLYGDMNYHRTPFEQLRTPSHGQRR